ncbi:MAG: hypothetical protein CM15mV8_2040 [Caudoviricetes sp.]|nr:MAG: hypothetical protein CM15mV8_2040 [Caudoviricetes sp.]
MVQNTGWIMRLPQDVKISTIGNGEDIKFDVLFNHKENFIVQKHLTHAFYLSLRTENKIQCKNN